MRYYLISFQKSAPKRSVVNMGLIDEVRFVVKLQQGAWIVKGKPNLYASEVKHRHETL
jgi:hypothetical protein